MELYLKREWKKIQEGYSADIKNSPYFKYWKAARDEGDAELMKVISGTMPKFLPYAIEDNKRLPMVAQRYGYKTEEEARKRIEQLKTYPRWKNVDKFEIDVIFGDYVVDIIEV